LQNTLPGPVAVLVNAPKSEIYGAELEASWRVMPRWPSTARSASCMPNIRN
jgi:iron complex outermembrane receptor protein